MCLVWFYFGLVLRDGQGLDICSGGGWGYDGSWTFNVAMWGGDGD